MAANTRTWRRRFDFTHTRAQVVLVCAGLRACVHIYVSSTYMVGKFGHEHLLVRGRELDLCVVPGPVARHKVREALGRVVQLAIEAGQLAHRKRGAGRACANGCVDMGIITIYWVRE